MSKSE